jgi:hypothetical protein
MARLPLVAWHLIYTARGRRFLRAALQREFALENLLFLVDALALRLSLVQAASAAVEELQLARGRVAGGVVAAAAAVGAPAPVAGGLPVSAAASAAVGGGEASPRTDSSGSGSSSSSSDGSGRPAPLPRSRAYSLCGRALQHLEDMVERYLRDTAPMQINVSDRLRRSVLDAVLAALEAGEAAQSPGGLCLSGAGLRVGRATEAALGVLVCLPWGLLAAAEREIFYLLVDGPVRRFVGTRAFGEWRMETLRERAVYAAITEEGESGTSDEASSGGEDGGGGAKGGGAGAAAAQRNPQPGFAAATAATGADVAAAAAAGPGWAGADHPSASAAGSGFVPSTVVRVLPASASSRAASNSAAFHDPSTTASAAVAPSTLSGKARLLAAVGLGGSRRDAPPSLPAAGSSSSPTPGGSKRPGGLASIFRRG